MEKKPIDVMVDRFLGWKLPADFAPDGGISFKRGYNEHTPYPMEHEPVGTNLLTADQAKTMLEYVLGGERMFTADEVAAAVIAGNKVMVDKLEELCTRVAVAEHQRDKVVADLEFAYKRAKSLADLLGIPVHESPEVTGTILGLVRSKVAKGLQ